ncbi:UNVERIFIED_CONTAM: hypothetical protein P3C91_23500, partial [Pseudomonas aeruginosa]
AHLGGDVAQGGAAGAGQHREQAQDYARRHGGEVRDFAAASQQALALR